MAVQHQPPDPSKDKLLWLRDMCRQKAGWHNKEARKWSKSVNPAHKEKVENEQGWADHWEKAAEELEKVIQAAIAQANAIIRANQ